MKWRIWKKRKYCWSKNNIFYLRFYFFLHVLMVSGGILDFPLIFFHICFYLRCYVNQLSSWVGPFFEIQFVLFPSYLVLNCRYDFFEMFESLLKFLMMTSTLNCISTSNKLSHFLKNPEVSKFKIKLLLLLSWWQGNLVKIHKNCIFQIFLICPLSNVNISVLFNVLIVWIKTLLSLKLCLLKHQILLNN